MTDLTEGKLDVAKEFARQKKDTTLDEQLSHLEKIDHIHGTETKLMPDFAPYSFYFERFSNGKFVSNGGIIFHGIHDGFGSGQAPTFSVCLEKTSGWAIHT
jgi:hypothetical protein